MKEKLLVGDIAEFFRISRQTVRYYDKIGLCKPKKIDKENGYRYYGHQQLDEFNIILFLKSLGFRLKKIKQHMENRNLESSKKLLAEQKAIVERRIRELEKMKNKLDVLIKETDYYGNLDISHFGVKRIKERNIIAENVFSPYSEVEFSVAFKKLNQLCLKENMPIWEMNIGGLVPIEKLRLSRYKDCSRLFILLNDEDYANAKTLPEGDYVFGYHRGNYESLELTYRKLVRFITSSGYEIVGDSVELYLLDFGVENNEKNYLSEIQIPVQKVGE